MELNKLRQLAMMGQIDPTDQISADQATWQPVHTQPELEMAWTIQIDANTAFGPVNRFALVKYLDDGRVPPTAAVQNPGSGESLPAYQVAMKMLMAQRNDLTKRLKAAGGGGGGAEAEQLKAKLQETEREKQKIRQELLESQAETYQAKESIKKRVSDGIRDEKDALTAQMNKQQAEADKALAEMREQKDSAQKQLDELQLSVDANTLSENGVDSVAVVKLQKDIEGLKEDLQKEQDSKLRLEEKLEESEEKFSDKKESLQEKIDDLKSKLEDKDQEFEEKLVEQEMKLESEFETRLSEAGGGEGGGVSQEEWEALQQKCTGLETELQGKEQQFHEQLEAEKSRLGEEFDRIKS
ncbi:MAG: hypothetical protein AAF492_08800, partial [Verrucomicrobiota bacterium]